MEIIDSANEMPLFYDMGWHFSNIKSDFNCTGNILHCLCLAKISDPGVQ